ncbi:choice-of-anchor M domain-containing protein [Rothia sp. P5764]|uniref:choice-of-anchor M domain-containing protein n=1 Tax=Rothia sp. P5764 TaxID=3402654 RepID=UPI003AD5E165
MNRISRLATALTLTTFLLLPGTPLGSASFAAEDNRSAQERALEQTLSSDEPTVTGQHEISEGHIDLGPTLFDGSWELMFRDDSGLSPVWRDPAEVVLRGNDTSLMAVPDDPRYSFVHAPPGEQVYVIPQTEAAGVVWPGWNTQNPQVVEELGRGVTLTLEKVEGPGDFFLYLENGNFAAPEVLWDSNSAGPQDIFVEPNTHVHANWVFTRPGAYYLTVRAHAELSDGRQVSDTAQLLFAIGSEVETEQVFSGARALSTKDQHKDSGTNLAAPSTVPAQASKTPREDSSVSPQQALSPALLTGIGLLVLFLLAGSLYLLRRSVGARSRALSENSGERS